MSDDDGSAGAAFEQSDAPQDQRPHDALAEACFLHHQVAQPWRWYDERLDRFDRPGIDQRRPRRQLLQLTGKIAWAVHDDCLAPAKPAWLRYLHLARRD